MDEKKQSICICLPKDVIEKGKDEAKQLGLSFSAYVSYLISKKK